MDDHRSAHRPDRYPAHGARRAKRPEPSSAAQWRDIRQERPGWYLFRDGGPGGESVAAVGVRADRVIARLRAIDGHVLLFSHGHFLRVLAARWLGLPAGDARLFVLSTAALSIIGYEHNLEEPAIRLWNDDRHVV